MKVFIAGKDFSQYFVGLPMREVGDTIKGHAADCGIDLQNMAITIDVESDSILVEKSVDGDGKNHIVDGLNFINTESSLGDDYTAEEYDVVGIADSFYDEPSTSN